MGVKCSPEAKLCACRAWIRSWDQSLNPTAEQHLLPVDSQTVRAQVFYVRKRNMVCVCVCVCVWRVCVWCMKDGVCAARLASVRRGGVVM